MYINREKWKVWGRIGGRRKGGSEREEEQGGVKWEERIGREEIEWEW